MSGKQSNTVSDDHANQAQDGGDPDAAANVRLRDITKTFDNGSIIAVDNVSLDIHSDEFVVFLGPSGCGKTTTMRCIAGLETPDSGSVFIDGSDVTNAKPKDRDIAFVFQEIALFPHMSVRKNISFGLEMKTDLSNSRINERVERTGEILGISDLLDRKPSELSGGQRQRISLGRAMVMEPAAFLLDEPFSALDANLRDKMQTEIKKLHRQLETAMVFVTHDQEEAMTLGDKIVVMRDGQVLQVDPPHKVYNDPKTRFIAEFIGSPSTNFIECALSERKRGASVECDLFELDFTAEQDPSLQGMDGSRISLGIRPEYLELKADDPLFFAEVTLIEPQGERDTIHLDADGHTFRATTSQGRIDRERVEVGVDLATDEIWLFDEEGGRLR